MKKFLPILALPILFVACGPSTTEPGNKTEPVKLNEINALSRADKGGSGVMLQGFTWTSPSDDGYWYNTMSNNADEIKDTFEYVWFPPCTDSTDNNGYLPRQLNLLTQAYTKNGEKSPSGGYQMFYGTEAQLKKAINDIKPCKAIADIVINHRCGLTNWGDFQNPDWGVIKGKQYPAICKDDEGFTNTKSDMFGAKVKGAADTGEKYDSGRDIDHTNEAVQDGIIEWLNTVMKGAGFVGWRYDMVKGYDGKYNGYYNAKTEPEFSVGEYWDGNVSFIEKWLDATVQENRGVAGVPGRAFDFVTKYALNAAFQDTRNYAAVAASNNLYKKLPGYAVTFVDNHDTGSTQAQCPISEDGIAPAYAFILTHPGYPCVAWFHYFDSKDCLADGDYDQYMGGKIVPGGTVTIKKHIQDLIALRKDCGITDLSAVEVLKAESSLYVGKVTGENKSVITVLGTGYDAPSGYKLYCSGTEFAVYVEE